MAPQRPRDPFRSERLVYRGINVQKDLSLFQAINNDQIGFMNSNANNIRLPSTSDAERFMKAVEESFLGVTICLPSQPDSDANGEVEKSGEAIGQIHLKGLPPRMQHHRHVEVGVDILPQYQGKGYGSEAINWALDYAFRKAGLHRVKIRAFGWNEGAIKLYERLGFKHEGREREALWHEGKFWDGIDMGMLDREWWELQKSISK